MEKLFGMGPSVVGFLRKRQSLPVPANMQFQRSIAHVATVGGMVRRTVFTNQQILATILGVFRYVVKIGKSILSKLRTKSALNPALYFAAMSLVVCASLHTLGKPTPWCVWLIGGSAINVVAAFWFLMFRDRDRLQSEDYMIEKQELLMLQDGTKTIRSSDPNKIEQTI